MCTLRAHKTTTVGEGNTLNPISMQVMDISLRQWRIRRITNSIATTIKRRMCLRMFFSNTKHLKTDHQPLLLYLRPSTRWEHGPSIKALHWILRCAMVAISCQVYPIFLDSDSTSRRQVFLGRPRFLCP